MGLITSNELQTKIFKLRGLQVMLDRDLAELYKVEVKRLNEQVKRNNERFPEDFRFQLNDHEKDELVAICDRFEKENIYFNTLVSDKNQTILFCSFTLMFR
jgi:hypothetical protein